MCTHTHTHTHTHTQGSRLCARRFTLAIAPDDWIKGDDFFLLLFCLSGLCAMTTNSSWIQKKKERLYLFNFWCSLLNFCNIQDGNKAGALYSSADKGDYFCCCIQAPQWQYRRSGICVYACVCQHVYAAATEAEGGATKLSGDVSHGELSPFPLATLSLSQAHLALSFRRDWEIFSHTHIPVSSNSPLLAKLAREWGCWREAQSAAIGSD